MLKSCLPSKYSIFVTVAFNDSASIKLFKYLERDCLLITHIYTTYMTQCQGLVYRSPLYKVLSSSNMIFKSDYILKILGTCIDCMFRNQSMFIESIRFWWVYRGINESIYSVIYHLNYGPYQWSLLWRQPFPAWDNPSFPVSLAGMDLVKPCIVIIGFIIKE